MLSPTIKVALLHYWLTNLRGGENVLAEFCRMFPEADIYTHAWNSQRIGAPFDSHPIHETWIGRLPGAKNNCQKYLPLMPWALKKLDLSDYRLLISSESGPIKGVRKPASALHVCYCHTPMRYLWDMYEEYYRNAGVTGKLGMRLFRDYLRRYDLASAGQVDHFIANSNFVADRIRRIYGRDAVVIYPPVNTDFFGHGTGTPPGDYYLVAGQLIAYKQPELAIKACLALKRRLILTGTGNLAAELAKRYAAFPSIQFIGRCSNEELRGYYAGARALLFPGVEDFGIVPLEAQAAGTPVIAYGGGGALETVVAGQTGLFFDQADPGALASAIRDFESRSWDQAVISGHAQKFTAGRFRDQFLQQLEQWLPS